MAIIADVPVNTSWVDINTVTGLIVGTSLSVMNKGGQSLFLTESVAEPTSDTEGYVLSSVGNNYATASILTGSLRVWCICPSDLGSILAVQDTT